MDLQDLAPRRPGRPALGPIIAQFERSARRRLVRMANTTPRHADLIAAFPALALALATERGGPDACARAHRLVRDGAPLAQTAQALDVPLWWRRLPADAFATALAPAFDAAQAAALFLPWLPRTAAARRRWFVWTMNAGVWTPPSMAESVALWVARQPVGAWNADVASEETLDDLLLLAAYAVAVADASLPTHAFAPKNGFPLRPKQTSRLGAFTLACRLDAWLSDALNRGCLAEARPVAGLWRKTIKVDGYKFAPRAGAEVLKAEGALMDNCLDTYAERVETAASRIYAVRRGGATVASLELAPDATGRTKAVQLSSRNNGPVGGRMRRAADRLAAQLGPWPEGAPRRFTHRAVDQARWRALWTPSWAAIDGLDRIVPRGHGAEVEERLYDAVERFYERSYADAAAAEA